jgi:hypothetical protein
MDWYREGGRQRSRVLYAFHGPVGARVGREAITPDTARMIQATYSHVVFDWTAILAERQVIESAPEVRRRRPRDTDAPASPPPNGATALASAAEPDAPTRAPSASAPRPAVPAVIEGTTPHEQIAFLEHWYPLVRERISMRASDPERQQALLALAERLNPGAWIDAEAIAAGLPQAAEALQRLSMVFARRRRSRRRPSAGGAPPASEPQAPA